MTVVLVFVGAAAFLVGNPGIDLVVPSARRKRTRQDCGPIFSIQAMTTSHSCWWGSVIVDSVVVVPKLAIRGPADRLGVHPVARRNGIRSDEADRSERSARPTTSESQVLRRLRRENMELKRANEILQAAGASSLWNPTPCLPTMSSIQLKSLTGAKAGRVPVSLRLAHLTVTNTVAAIWLLASTTVALTLDTHGRISEETLTDGTHLIHRRFVYSNRD